ncbi:MAG: glycosyltransferase family 1 protein [Congregibacter sp.]
MLSELRADIECSAQQQTGAGIRVAFFSDAFPERNGTGAYYHDLIAQLVDLVDELVVFQPQFEGGTKPLVSIPMPGDKGQRLTSPPLKSIRARCNELKPSVIVVVTPGLFGLLGVYESRRTGATLISAFHTDFEQLARIYWNPVSRFFVNLVLRSANRLICRASKSVLINNAGLRDDVLSLGAREVDVIGTPLPRDFLERPRISPSAKLTRVCFAGRLAPEKNVEYIITAARELPEIEFVIGGDGPLRTRLKGLAAGLRNVKFVGWLNRSALIDLIDRSDLLLLPSAFETFGSVALEAMARGRPALVSTTAGIHAWPALRPGLFSLDDPSTLADQLRELSGLTENEWIDKAHAASDVAMTLNQRTINHWVGLLMHYQAAALPAPRS